MNDRTQKFDNGEEYTAQYTSTIGNISCWYNSPTKGIDEWNLEKFDLQFRYSKRTRLWEMSGSALKLSGKDEVFEMNIKYEELHRKLEINILGYQFDPKPLDATFQYYPSLLSLEIKILRNIEGKNDDGDHYTIKTPSHLLITHWSMPRKKSMDSND